MKIIIRKAEQKDAQELFKIKTELTLPLAKGDQQGGFLVSTSLEKYRFFIENAFVRVLEDLDHNQVIGFSIVLPDAVVRTSELWQKKESVRWENFDPAELESKKIAFYEQLAILPDPAYRRYAMLLAFANAPDAIETGHNCLLTTIVNYPVRNRAALPFLEGVGCTLIGGIEEIHPGIGVVQSDIYYVDKAKFAEKLNTHPIIKKVITDLNEIIL